MTEFVARNPRPLTGPTGQLVSAHRDEIRTVLHRQGVTDARIFGSVARRDDHEGSDVDLLVGFPPDTSLLEVIGIQMELEELLGVRVDLVPATGLKQRVLAAAEPDLIAL